MLKKITPCIGASAFFLPLLSAFCAFSSHALEKKPNVVIFITDDQSPMNWRNKDTIVGKGFGFCGEDRVYTPNIDALAKNGIVFSRAYVPASVSSASRYALLTGQYPSRCTGTVFSRLFPSGSFARVENDCELNKDLPNIASVLKANGYRTGFVGKSHVVEHDLVYNKRARAAAGMREYAQDADPRDPKVNAIMKSNHDIYAAKLKEYGFDFAGGVYGVNLKELNNDALNVHNLEWTVKNALDFLNTCKQDEPFFLYFSTTLAHGPQPWNRPGGKFKFSFDADSRMTGEGYREYDYSFMPSRKEVMQKTLDAGKDAGEAWITWTDEAVKVLVEKLKNMGEFENTVFIIMSDHGDWRRGKATCYEGGLRIPLAIHYPPLVKSGTKYGGLVQSIDLIPTIFDVAKIEKPENMLLDGKSLKSALEGSNKKIHDYLYAELGFSRAIITPTHKYIAIRYDAKTREKIAAGKRFPSFKKGETTALPYLLLNAHLGSQSAEFNPHYFDADQIYDLLADEQELDNIYKADSELARKMKAYLAEAASSIKDRPFGEFNENCKD